MGFNLQGRRNFGISPPGLTGPSWTAMLYNGRFPLLIFNYMLMHKTLRQWSGVRTSNSFVTIWHDYFLAYLIDTHSTLRRVYLIPKIHGFILLILCIIFSILYSHNWAASSLNEKWLNYEGLCIGTWWLPAAVPWELWIHYSRASIIVTQKTEIKSLAMRNEDRSRIKISILGFIWSSWHWITHSSHRRP